MVNFRTRLRNDPIFFLYVHEALAITWPNSTLVQFIWGWRLHWEILDPPPASVFYLWNRLIIARQRRHICQSVYSGGLHTRPFDTKTLLSSGSKVGAFSARAPLRPKVFAFLYTFLEIFGKIVGWRTLLRGILDPTLLLALPSPHIYHTGPPRHVRTSYSLSAGRRLAFDRQTTRSFRYCAILQFKWNPTETL